MSLPTMTGVGRLTADPELRFSASGTAVCTVNLAFNNRKKDQQSGEWVDDGVFFVRATCFKDQAEQVAENLRKGMECLVVGRLKTEQWDDKATGDKRSATALLVDSIGPSLRFPPKDGQTAQRPAQGQRDTSWGGGNDEAPF